MPTAISSSDVKETTTSRSGTTQIDAKKEVTLNYDVLTNGPEAVDVFTAGPGLCIRIKSQDNVIVWNATIHVHGTQTTVSGVQKAAAATGNAIKAAGAGVAGFGAAVVAVSAVAGVFGVTLPAAVPSAGAGAALVGVGGATAGFGAWVAGFGQASTQPYVRDESKSGLTPCLVVTYDKIVECESHRGIVLNAPPPHKIDDCIAKLMTTL